MLLPSATKKLPKQTQKPAPRARIAAEPIALGAVTGDPKNIKNAAPERATMNPTAVRVPAGNLAKPALRCSPGWLQTDLTPLRSSHFRLKTKNMYRQTASSKQTAL